MHQIRRSSRLVAVFALAALAMASLAAAEIGQVNLNTASVQELTNLPRIGTKVAERIVAFRKQNGSFKTAEDLMHVKGIGEKSFNMLKPYLTITGKTTLGEKVRLSRPKKPSANVKPASNPTSTKPASTPATSR